MSELHVSAETATENIYWLPDANGQYSGLQQMPAARVTITAKKAGADSIAVTVSNPAGGPVAFFNRLSLVNAADKQRILPVFYSDNYVTVLPGDTKTIFISGAAVAAHAGAQVEVYGHNVAKQYITVL